MVLKRLKISNFRCLEDIEVLFDEALTVLVGENDSGKSSLLEVLRLMFSGGTPEPEDFAFNSTTMIFELELMNGKQYSFQYQKENDDTVTVLASAIVDWARLRSYLEDENKIEALTFDDVKNILKEYGKSSKKRSEGPIKDEFRQFLQENKTRIQSGDKGAVPVDGSSLDSYELIHADGKKFEDINAFIKDVYLKSEIKEVWDREIPVGESTESLSSLLRNLLNEVQNEKQREINDHVLPRLKEYLKDVKEVTVNIENKEIDLSKNISVHVGFVDASGQEVLVEKKGDGTKRRMTLALLGQKAENETSSNGRMYLLDEPDTHLHVRAQHELLSVLAQLSENNQVIITTHSPFILNGVEAANVRLLDFNNGKTHVKSVQRDEEMQTLLSNLGIENINLFFTRKLFIVEGKSEHNALPILFKRYTGRSMNSHLISIIDAGNCHNAAQLATVLCNLFFYIPITILLDKDVERSTVRRNTRKLLKELQDKPHVSLCTVGYKELEDAFDDETIFEAVSKHCNHGNEWTLEIVREARKCLVNNPNFQFGNYLAKRAGESVSKPDIAVALAKHCPLHKIPNELVEVFKSLE